MVSLIDRANANLIGPVRQDALPAPQKWTDLDRDIDRFQVMEINVSF